MYVFARTCSNLESAVCLTAYCLLPTAYCLLRGHTYICTGGEGEARAVSRTAALYCRVHTRDRGRLEACSHSPSPFSPLPFVPPLPSSWFCPGRLIAPPRRLVPRGINPGVTHAPHIRRYSSAIIPTCLRYRVSHILLALDDKQVFRPTDLTPLIRLKTKRACNVALYL